MLDVRARTTTELRRRLARRGHASADIDRTIERLLAVGLLDDAAYAAQFTRVKLAGGGAAPARVRQDLVQRGLDRGTAAAAVRRVITEDGVDMASVLDDLACRRARTLARFDDATRRRRLYAYLARRGFEPEDIRHALERALASEGQGE
jgi:regulatory protein